MEKVLTDEERDALLEIFQNGEQRAGDGASPADRAPLAVHDTNRRFIRLPQRLEAVLRAGGRRYPVLVTNIGLGGVFVCSETDLPVDELVEMEIAFQNPEAITHARGQVCWQKRIDTKTRGLGIRFSALDTDDLWAIVANLEQTWDEVR